MTDGRLQPIFDGHNDALTSATATELATGRPDGHLDLPRARAGGLAGGIFAVFTESPGGDRAEPPPIAHETAVAHAARTAAALFALEAKGEVRVVRGTADLDRSLADGRIAAVLHLEGAEALDPELRTLEQWYEAGLRSLGPVWSRPNAFGHGVPFRYPSSPDTGPGLTAAGRRLVGRCNELGIAVDASHLNEAGFWDLARITRAPLIASHVGAHALCPASRNLTDQQLSAVGATGGIVGIAFAAPFLRADGADDANTPLEAIVAHVRHVADRIGADHVGLGSDFDGATIPAPLGDAAGLPRLIAALRQDGFSPREVDAIAWGNWRRVLGATWSE